MVEAPGSARRSPFGSRLLGPREQDPRKLRQRVRLLLTALLLMTNLAGAVVTLVINLWAVPAPPPSHRLQVAMAIGIPVYVVAGAIVGVLWGTAASLSALRWATEPGSVPDDPARRRALRVPLQLTLIQFVIWFGGCVLSTAILTRLQPSRALITGLTILIGAVVVSGIAYLFCEFALRPISARAMSGIKVTRALRGVGVGPRMVLFWVVGTAAPVLGLLAIASIALHSSRATIDQLAIVTIATCGVVLVTAAATGGWRASTLARRHGPAAARVLLVVAILTTSIWQVATAARDAVGASGQTSWGSDIDPVLAQLEQRRADLGRVEVVPTRSHREAAVFAPHVPLARGWNRQADAERNRLFYRDRPLTEQAYRRWLHRWAVQYVVLSTAQPDAAAVAETDLITGGLPYLEPVWSDEHWTLYAVRRPTPLVSPPARVVSFDADHLTLFTPSAGDVVVRIADSPWLSVVDVDRTVDVETSFIQRFLTEPCLSGLDAAHGVGPVDAAGSTHPRRDNWLVLHAPSAGTYRISAPYKLPRGTSCP